MAIESQKQILVCQNRSCRKAGSARILAAFGTLAPPDLTVVACGCLGHCGSGPMVLVLPDQTLYNHLYLQDVEEIIHQACE